MATVDLMFPGATQEQLNRGLAAAGDILRNCAFEPSHLRAAWELRDAINVATPEWVRSAVQVVEMAQAVAFAACYDGPAPPGARLVLCKPAPLD